MLTKCPEKKDSNKPISFSINAQGIGERVVVNIEPMCECDCEKEAIENNVKNNYNNS